MQNGTCINFGLCTRADTKQIQTVADGGEFVCQECKRRLAPASGMATSAAGRSTNWLGLAMVGLLLAILVGGGLYFLSIKRSTDVSNPVDAPARVIAAPVLRLSGSNTIGAQLAPDLVEGWLRSKGAIDVRRSNSGVDNTAITGTVNGTGQRVEVRAHGSATAFTDLASQSCDIGMASRKIKPQEASELAGKGLGDLTSNADERVLGLDGVAIIVNETSRVDSMTTEEVGDIFSGSQSKQVWDLNARDAKSGTYDTFKDRVLGSRTLESNAKRFEDSRELVSTVAKENNGIGFVGLPYAVGVKVLAIAEKGATPMVPNTLTVRTEAYPLSRRLYFYLPDTAKPEAREFVSYALSPQGQDIVERDGFVGQKIDVVKEQAPASAPRGYLDLMPTADRLSADFRFHSGSSELDTKAVDDIRRVAIALSKQYAGRGAGLVGFSDITGGAAANLKLSKQRAQAVAAQLERQGITPVFVTGFGQDLPVADNSTTEGREKNRRVELWLRK